MLTQAQITVGQGVTLDAGSKWFGSGDNPGDIAVTGTITGTEGEWIDVIWPGKSEPLNYKSYDLNPA